MSLLLEALKKAERNKQDAPPGAGAGGELSLMDEDLPRAAAAADAAADPAAAERQAGLQLFAAKDGGHSRRVIAAAHAVAVVALAAAGGAWVWYQTQARPEMIATYTPELQTTATAFLAKVQSHHILADWAEVIRQLQIDTDDFSPYSVGFIFDRTCEAAFCYRQTRPCYLLNPTTLKNFHPYEQNEIIDRAIHEFAHHRGTMDHTETFTSAEITIRRDHRKTKYNRILRLARKPL